MKGFAKKSPLDQRPNLNGETSQFLPENNKIVNELIFGFLLFMSELQRPWLLRDESVVFPRLFVNLFPNTQLYPEQGQAFVLAD